MKSSKAILVAAVCALLALALVLEFMSTRQSTTVVPPNPNGYNDLVNAAQLVTGAPGDASSLELDALRDLIRSNAEPLRILRVGLDRPCVMPMNFAVTNSTVSLNQLAEIKRLAQLLAAEGILAELENRPENAGRSYADAIRFGNAISRGGMLITRLVGIACEGIGCQKLAKVLPELNPQAARVILAQLQQIDSERVQWAEVLSGERHYVAFLRANLIQRLVGWWQTRAAIRKAELKHVTIIARERLLMTELALRAYKADSGRVPVDLNELVPKYLAKLPEDPFSGRPMIFRAEGTNWQLYSLGPDRADDGGHPIVGRTTPVKGDLFFDSP